MKAIIRPPVCDRCGYKYNPLNPDKQVIQFVCEDGRVVSVCKSCIEEVGIAKEKGDDDKAEKIMDEIIGGKENV